MEEIPNLTEFDIQQKTWQILNAAYPEGIPVPIPIEDLIELHFKVGLEFTDFEEDFKTANIDVKADGFTCFFQDKIFINSPLNQKGQKKRTRFSMSHELGHYVLHRHYLYVGKTPSQCSDLYLKNHLELDKQADKFAAHLLIPTPLLYKKWLEWCKNYYFLFSYQKDYSFLKSMGSSLADDFEVSLTSMNIQLLNFDFFSDINLLYNTDLSPLTMQNIQKKCMVSPIL
jgi:Zn-dependent peptidase ImmA (M78 family)